MRGAHEDENEDILYSLRDSSLARFKTLAPTDLSVHLFMRAAASKTRLSCLREGACEHMCDIYTAATDANDIVSYCCGLLNFCLSHNENGYFCLKVEILMSVGVLEFGRLYCSKSP